MDRVPLQWPGGARVAVWPMLAIEHFVWGKPGTAIQPLLTEHPEVANWAWRDYGNRMGVWRLFDLFDELRVPLTVCLSADACQYYPRIVDAIRTHPEWAILPHGLNNNTAGHRQSRFAIRRQLGFPFFNWPDGRVVSHPDWIRALVHRPRAHRPAQPARACGRGRQPPGQPGSLEITRSNNR